MDSILLIGQSNMVGFGDPAEVEPVSMKSIKVLRHGRWTPVTVAINPYCDRAGACIAETFARSYADKYDTEVGLIPCAHGDTNIGMWGKGQALYDYAICNAKIAMRTSNLKAILWHQGESECDDYEIYGEKLIKFINDVRADLGLPNVPFIVGELGAYLVNHGAEKFKYYAEFNSAIKEVSEKMNNVGYASAEGLTDLGDHLHFNAKSLHTFGYRYFDEYVRLTSKD
ncbi:MAG: sialate O-acetylesterase [Ruminococcaceae bacterium]|nr:sialate O-acetylesterase [Oscillospiraceae bacterium]